MQLLRNFFKKIVYLFSNNKGSITCPFCNSKNIKTSHNESNSESNFYTREYLAQCMNCNRLGIHREEWSRVQTKKSILTDIEVEIDS